MREIVKVNLENEMDLILAHKRAMKLAELCGLSLSIQTSFATAVSEIARIAIDYGNNSCLILSIEVLKAKEKYLKALICDNSTAYHLNNTAAIHYAQRLVDTVEVTKESQETKIALNQKINFPGTITEAKINSFIEYFEKEPPLSPYDEIRKKNVLLQDLTEKLQERENEYRQLTERLPIMMFSTNAQGHITFFNKWFHEFLGTLPAQLESSMWRAVIHPDDYTLFSKSLHAALAQRTPLNGEYRLKHNTTGNFIWHLISVLPAKNEKESITEWTGFIVDIHAQKQVEQTLKDNQDLKNIQQKLVRYKEELEDKILELNRSNYELEQFAHLASHDLQEPLRKLFFYTDMLKKKYGDKLDSSGSTMLNSMTQSASRMKELITDLLTYSQLHQHEFEFESTDLNDILSGVLKDFDIAIKERNASINISPLPVIEGHPIKLRQLFSNLLSNALKYSRKDVIPRIDIRGEVADNAVVISFADNGIGFDEKFNQQIFGLFERLHSKDRYPGTGIGLSICKRIAELHHGTITATARQNEYARFEITLPMVQ